MTIPHRKHPAHGVTVIPSQVTVLLVTVCTEKRKPWAACDEVHRILREVWMEATGWHVGHYVILPDHLHYFATLGTMDISLERWSQFWKSRFSNRYLHQDCEWQTDHWDTRIRHAEHYHDRLEYIHNNPVRKGFVNHPDAWPYRGEISVLHWE